MGLTIRKALIVMFMAMALPTGTAAASTGGTTVKTPADLTELAPEELMKIEVETVYTASRFEQKVTEAPSSVSIVTADEIRKYGYRTLADILRSLRSFYITYDRNYSYVGVRGFGHAGDYNSRILLLVDGHRINDNLYDSAPLGTEFVVDVDMIDRVEVIRGPGSSLYGNNAFFAVINVITKRGRDLGGVELSGDTGSFDSYKGRLSYGRLFSKGLEALVSGSIYDSGGDSLFFSEFDYPRTNNGFTGHTDYDRFYNTLAKLSYAGLVLEGVYSSRTKGIPTAPYGTDFNDGRNKSTDEWWFADLKYNRSLGKNLDVMGRLFYDSYEFDGGYVYSGNVDRDLAHGRWWGAEAQLAASLMDRHRLVLGAEYRDNIRQDQESFFTDPYGLIYEDKRRSDIWAFYLQDEFTILRNLILSAGARYDHYSTFGGTFNPRLALIYTPVDGTVLKFLYGSAFRAPNVFELYNQDPTAPQKANPGLQPETIDTYELICEHYMGSHIWGTINGFYYTIKDLIVLVTDPSDGFLVYRNLSRVDAKGIEAELDGKWENGWAGRVSYSYQDARDSDTGQPLVNSPRNLAKLDLTVPLLRDKIFLGIEEQLTDRRKTLAGRYTKLFFVTNLTLFSRNLLKNLELSASVYNLFDYRYGDPGGSENVQDVIQQDGTTFRVKLTYRF